MEIKKGKKRVVLTVVFFSISNNKITAFDCFNDPSGEYLLVHKNGNTHTGSAWLNIPISSCMHLWILIISHQNNYNMHLAAKGRGEKKRAVQLKEMHKSGIRRMQMQHFMRHIHTINILLQ